MRIAIRIALLIVIGVLSYFTYESVMGDVRYAEEVETKEQLVIDKLKIIQTAQIAYKDEHKRFTSSFDTLISFMQNGKMLVTKEVGDKDDSTTVFRIEESYQQIRTELFSELTDEQIKNIRYVPLHDTLQFKIQARTILKNEIKVPVFQVTDTDPFSKERVKEENPLRVGDIFEADITGKLGREIISHLCLITIMQ